MATINLGRIKPVFRGAYSGGTAYVVDDIVTSGGSSYICIQAHGAGTQAVTETAYWSVLAATGTDVGTTITTQGDVLYRDGSGLQRLAKPASNLFLQNTSGGVLSWAAAGGGLQSTQQFTASGTWTKPAGITKIRVFCTGAGGSGGGSNDSSDAGAGGGAGGTAIEFLDATSLTSETVTIGAGGTTVSGENNGVTGGTTSFGSLLSKYLINFIH